MAVGVASSAIEGNLVITPVGGMGELLLIIITLLGGWARPIKVVKYCCSYGL